MNVLKVPYGSKDAAKLFAKSLKETGFAVVTEHPIAKTLIDEVYADWARFFNTDEKFQHKFDPTDQSGYFPFRSENAKGNSIKDLKEFYHVYPRSKLPESFSNATWDLYKQLTTMAAELLTWVQQETPESVTSRFSQPLPDMIKDSGENLLRILHYPPLVGSEEEGAIRAGAHEDINIITLLPAATAPGLQVKDNAGNWIDVPCDPGNIVVNSGDMLKMASDGYYGSTTHQVVNPKGPAAKEPRYSMPLFLHPRPDVKLSSTMTAAEYLAQRLREIGLKTKA
jgi:isopenicillin N synthase-like dioxygenase